MSWDVLLMNPPPGITSVEELGEDLPPLGSRKEVLSTLTQLFPNGDFSDTSWGVLRTEDYSVNFNLGNDDPLVIIVLHIRGSDEASSVIQKICEHTGWRAYDTSRDEFIDFAKNPEASLRQWRAYKNQIVAYLETKGKDVKKELRNK